MAAPDLAIVEEYSSRDLRPPLVLRVGISGHRSLYDRAQWDLLQPRLRKALADIQNATQNAAAAPRAYSGASPLMRATSPLAEGADRLFAREALALGYELQCPLPFDRLDYYQDFGDAHGPHPPSIPPAQAGGKSPKDSIEEFEELLGQAIAVLEFDGTASEEKRGAAYSMVGRAVLDHSDLLIVIWDGKPARGAGGTEEIKQLALERNKPVIWLKVPSESSPASAQSGLDDRLLWPGNSTPDQPLGYEAIQKVVDWLVLPPWIRSGEEPDPTASYAAHPAGFGFLNRMWQLFTRVMSSRLSPAPQSPALDPALQLPDPFQEQYELANAPAKRFAGAYRGAFLMASIAGVCAVFFALLGIPLAKWEKGWLWSELVAIVIALGLVARLRQRRWHYRAVDCRYLAEQMRILRYTYPLGLTSITPQLPAHQLHGDLSGSWMQWRLTAIVRSIPLPHQRFEPVFLRRCYSLMADDWVAGQIAYHERNKRQLEVIEKRLHILAWVFLTAAAVACLLHLMVHQHDQHDWGRWLILFAAGLPAASAACHGISNQGEFRRLVLRSEAMAASLERTHKELEKIHHNLSADALQRKAAETGQVMLAEVVDWQILYRKPVDAA